MTAEQRTVAEKLCAGCGMCCDGVMFYSVQLQETDSGAALKSHGIRLKKKKGQIFIPQPCPAHKNNGCSIYQDRPQRCRLFNCKQMVEMESGKITAGEAEAKVRQTRALADSVLGLLLLSGSTNLKRSLRTRYDLVLAQPIETITDPEALRIRNRLVLEMEALEDLLTADFRIPAVKDTVPAEA